MLIKIKSSRLKEEENSKYIEFTIDQLGSSTTEWPEEAIRIIFERFPALLHHNCKYPKNGGFLRVVNEGTTFAHVAQHIAMILQHEELTNPESLKLSDGNEVIVTIPCTDYDEGRDAFKFAISWLESVLSEFNSKN